jgi:glycosyltransferase involved in cell wall biosynthesis
MRCKPDLVLCHTKKRKPRVSIILIDWGVRESFHSLHYLNRQTVAREDFELIWVEFHDHKPLGLQEMAATPGQDGGPTLDKWITLGYPPETHYHKHRMYNVGILLAEGEFCVICDSDAMFSPMFVEKLLASFADTPNAVIHLDEIRNNHPCYYPFNYPTIAEFLSSGTINWQGHTTLGLDDSPDMLHHANYGACMAARRTDLIAIGGADEDLDYLGYVCGPYEMTFRLANFGRVERWLRDEWIYHTWHPNQYGFNVEYQGPHDGFHMSMPALEARASKRTRPYLRNPWMRRARWTGGIAPESLVRLLAGRPEPTWHRDALPQVPGERVYWMQRDYFGFNLFNYAGSWYALRVDRGRLDAGRLRAGTYDEVWQANSWQELRDRLPIDHHLWSLFGSHVPLPLRLWRKATAPRLPARLLRKARRLVNS